jgi:ribose-phosphate pyrophosphokinase
MGRSLLGLFTFLYFFLFTSTTYAQHEIMLFTGNANRALAEKVSEYMHIPLGSAFINTFNDGEIQIHINESVRGKDIFIIQPTCQNETQSVNDSLLELYLLIRTMKRASAHSITAILPYYGYARQDRKTTSRVPISAADVACMLEIAGVDRIVTIDLHCGQIQGFFRNIPVDNLFASPLFVSYIAHKDLRNVVVVSPDAGGVERAKKFAESLKKKGVEAAIAMISKERKKAGVIESMNLIGDVQGSDAIIVDDLCDTGGTLVKAAALIKAEGARRVFAVITHPVFSGNALDTIRNSVLEEMLITDTVPLKKQAPPNLHLISVAPLIGEAIQRIHQGESVSMLFE